MDPYSFGSLNISGLCRDFRSARYGLGGMVEAKRFVASVLCSPWGCRQWRFTSVFRVV